jgi:hypothetical protein
MYQAADALAALQSQNVDALQENILGSQLNEQVKSNAAEAQATANAIKDGTWGEAASSTGTMILGRQKIYDMANGVKQRFNEKYKGNEAEEGEGEGTELTETGDAPTAASDITETFQGGFGDGAGGASAAPEMTASAAPGAEVELSARGASAAPDATAGGLTETAQGASYGGGQAAQSATEMTSTRAMAARGTSPAEAGAGDEVLSANPAVTAETGVASSAEIGGEAAAVGGAEAATEVGVAAGAAATDSALVAAGAAMSAIPVLDLVGGALLIGGIAAPLIMDAVDKKKERKEKKKAKAQAAQQQQDALNQYQATVAQHNAAMQSLTSNHHAAITGGIVQKTDTSASSGTF